MIKTAVLYRSKEVKIDVTNISLPTIDEAIALPEETREYCSSYWLQSSGDFYSIAACVCNDGSVYDYGSFVYTNDIAVRPVITISNLDSFHLEVEDLIEIQGKEYIVISEDKVLYNDKPIFHRFDSVKNHYSGSEIEGIVKGWLQEDEDGERTRD